MSIGRNSVYNLVGAVVPVLLALLTVPAYLSLIGTERYGVLAIAWLILGYFGMFDLGLGRATAQRIAALRNHDASERTRAFFTALAANGVIGVIGGLILWPVASYVFGEHINMSEQLRPEIVAAVPLLAIAVPIATMMGVLSGALMGREQFRTTNSISIVSTTLFQLLPLGYAWIVGPYLPGLLIASIGARAVGLMLLWVRCRREFPLDSADRRFDRDQLRPLLAYGGWVTLTSMFGPFLVIADRFAIGALLNAVAVTIYTVPMQITQRLSSVAGALGNALFPRMAVSSGDEAQRLAQQATAAMICVVSLPVTAGMFLIEPFLRFWVGSAVGGPAAPIGRILLIAWWLNTFAQLPYVQLQARGRPDLVSKLLIAELPVYLAGLYMALSWFGLLGAAVMFLVRIAADYLILSFLAGRKVQLPLPTAILLTLLTICAITMPRLYAAGPLATILAAGVMLALTALICWSVMPPALGKHLPAALRRDKT